MIVKLKNIDTIDHTFSFATIVSGSEYLIFDSSNLVYSKETIDELSIEYVSYDDIDDLIARDKLCLISNGVELNKEDSRVKLEYLRKYVENLKPSDLNVPTYLDSGALLVGQTYGDGGNLHSYWKQILFFSDAGEMNYHDYKITTEMRIGYFGYFIQSDIDPNDYIEISVIDKDDVLGLFSMYGLTVDGNNFLELIKTVKDWHPTKEYEIFDCKYDDYVVTSGLYVRIAYRSYGKTSIKINSILQWYE